MTVDRVIPMLRIFDVAKAKEFYVDYLGFKVAWEHRIFEGSPLVMEVSRGGLSLMLTEHHGDCCPGAAISVWLTGLDAFHSEIRSRKYAYLNPGIEDAPWGSRLMRVLDPFGNKILFNEKRPAGGN